MGSHIGVGPQSADPADIDALLTAAEGIARGDGATIGP
jgi:hypothetical protein